ncbi:RluA family pseudouridine synthase [Paenactinomyces guangxiensis]|uniref:Pseudouridine synthase n=1 Tax=Paenactinomyces guangxiensis TaxID=1490290 RepID=A0A7W1WPE3_9BACL|nr:RluA family pseudouridine synthase [Paenactinomyces guangxiensis]MBA4493627.1 RluA family pseudouridine synthase [Paenactinomyces guangxiensis]MBH8590914.1 RluA family pseudouridine synthase [Paenactinomyces guangxiensis]
MNKQSHYSKWLTFHVSEKWNQATVESILKGPLMISNRMLNRLTRMKGIRLNGRTPWLKQTVRTGDRLQVAVRPREKADLEPKPVHFQTLYEDQDMMIVDKPAGVAVHPVRGNDRSTLVHGILYQWEQRGFTGVVRPVHRLDRGTSGLILIAKNAYMHQLLDRQLRQRQVKRRYLAVLGTPLRETKGTITQPIGRDPRHPLRRRVTSRGEPAITHYRVVRQNKHGSLVQAELETGRTHQIRVHFSHLGAPLLGDSLYGGDVSFIQRQALHSSELSLTHPLTEKNLSFSSPLPSDLKHLLGQLQIKLLPL